MCGSLLNGSFSCRNERWLWVIAIILHGWEGDKGPLWDAVVVTSVCSGLWWPVSLQLRQEIGPYARLSKNSSFIPPETRWRPITFGWIPFLLFLGETWNRFREPNCLSLDVRGFDWLVIGFSKLRLFLKVSRDVTCWDVITTSFVGTEANYPGWLWDERHHLQRGGTGGDLHAASPLPLHSSHTRFQAPSHTDSCCVFFSTS